MSSFTNFKKLFAAMFPDSTIGKSFQSAPAKATSIELQKLFIVT